MCPPFFVTRYPDINRYGRKERNEIRQVFKSFKVDKAADSGK